MSSPPYSYTSLPPLRTRESAQIITPLFVSKSMEISTCSCVSCCLSFFMCVCDSLSLSLSASYLTYMACQTLSGHWSKARCARHVCKSTGPGRNWSDMSALRVRGVPFFTSNAAFRAQFRIPKNLMKKLGHQLGFLQKKGSGEYMQHSLQSVSRDPWRHGHLNSA